MPDMPDPTKIAELLAEHYQKTYEITYEMWRERNRLFPTLAGVIGGAMVLAFHVPGADSLFAAVIGGLLRLDAAAMQAIQQGFTYQIFQTVLMAVVFHLLLDLYRHNQDIARNYKYLAGMESELRRMLGIGADELAFSREDGFYRKNKVALLGGVRAVYTLALGVLLTLFLYARISDDILRGDVWFIVGNAIIAVPMAVYYLDYALPGLFNRKKS